MSFWSYCAPLRLAFSLFDFCAVYFATLLGRCAILSLPVLFLGKLDVYYKSPVFLPFVYWQSWCGGYWWLRWGYLAGVAVSLALLTRRRVRLRKMLRGLPSANIGGQRVYLCDMPVSPFTAGLVSPKIVIPKIARR